MLSFIIDDEHTGDKQLNLKGKLILADPSLRDGNFSRSVLILTEHSHEVGAQGYILNRPLGKTVGDVLPSEDFPGIESVPIFFGGPVDQEQLTFAALEWDSSDGTITIQTHLSTSNASERLKDGAHVRAFVGYSGWGAGQLESELKHRSWITSNSQESILHSDQHEQLWSGILKSMGPYFYLVAMTPDDPSLN
ncbi:MAG: putative transcriptional regulator [Verrucomicrobiales bacterium]